DGAAAAVVGDEGPGPHILGFSSLYAWEHIDALGFELGSAGFLIVLDPNIPDIIASHIEAAVDGLLERHGVAHQDVAMWCFHPGGSRILDAVQRRLSLNDSQMAASRHVLAHHGNMSSPTVMFVLAESLRSGGGTAGKYALLAAFGPGLGIELCLLGLQS
ncbi:MAG: alkylresorcinol/alkylpyrone synthase, partial [Kiritimatiellia bacterium]